VSHGVAARRGSWGMGPRGRIMVVIQS
jgi:hypothetical protein